MNTIAITGASGFIGGHLVRRLLREGGHRIKVLSRASKADATQSVFLSGVEVIEGDLRDLASLEGFLEPGCTVVNLVYLGSEDEATNLAAVSNLLAACRSASVRRLVHCSTADVVGRTPDRRVVEGSPCRPVTTYAAAKLKVEAAILAPDPCSHDVAILRPTAVFGPGGQNLRKLAQDLVAENHLRNALKACAFGHRRMHLVHVDNVVAAIIFLLERPHAMGKEVFIVSDDDAPANDFAGVASAMVKMLGIRGLRLPKIYLPSWLLSLMLRALRKDDIDPMRAYDPGKLLSLGFKRPVPFEEGLSRYIDWYRSACLGRPKTVEP